MVSRQYRRCRYLEFALIKAVLDSKLLKIGILGYVDSFRFAISHDTYAKVVVNITKLSYLESVLQQCNDGYKGV